MRLFIINMLTLGLMLVMAGSSQAINLKISEVSVGGEAGGAYNVGDDVLIRLNIDTEGDGEINNVFFSIAFNPGVLAFDSGTSPASILYNSTTYAALGRISNPFTLGTDPAGAVRAVSYSSPTGTGVNKANQKVADITLKAVGGGVTSIQTLLQGGDSVTSCASYDVEGNCQQQDLAGGATFNSIDVTVIPEPTTALLLGLGLVGLGLSGRKRA